MNTSLVNNLLYQIIPSSTGFVVNTLMSPTYTNFQPLRLALTAKSISSTVVRSFHPPASLIAEILHTPAVPALNSLLSYDWILY